MKTVLFAPGNKQDMTTHNYEATLATIRNQGYKTIFVPITWRATSMDEWLPQFEAEYNKHNPNETILAGFSYGAMIALAAAAKKPPSGLWLMSLAPFFSEDLNILRLAWLFVKGRQRIKPFQKLSFNKLAPLITCKTLVFIGEVEAKRYRSLENRALSAEKQIKNCKLIRIPNGIHDVTSQNYIQSLKDNI